VSDREYGELEIELDRAQCAAQRPVSGGRAGFAVLKCYLLDGHDGPHFDATEGIEWSATRLQGCGGVHQAFLRSAS
jgi:hypothetical protein